MAIAQDRFEFYFKQIENTIEAGEANGDVAEFLYDNGARNSLFMLEGLSRLYEKIYDKKRFTKLKEEVKIVEDILGDIDYYDSFVKDFEKIPGIKESWLQYLKGKKNEHLNDLNSILQQNKWTTGKKGVFDIFRKKIEKTDWLTEQEDLEKIASLYNKTIEKINETYLPMATNGFTKVEEEVHELRRDLRWLSIYPQALRGAIQLSDPTTPEDGLRQYQTAEIVGSPFNVLPEPKNNKFILYLDRNRFYALSWMIDKLGDLKDEGLQVYGLAEAIEKIELSDHENSIVEAEKIFNNPGFNREHVLNEASSISREYFSKNYLKDLVMEISRKEQ